MNEHCILAVWGNPDADLDDVFLEDRMGQANASSPIFAWDPVSGSCYPDDQWTEPDLKGGHLADSRAMVHGKHLVNSSNAQSPLPMVVGGGDALGPTGK